MQGKPTAGVGWRVLAFILDSIIWGALYWGIFFIFAEDRDAARAKLQPGESINTYVNVTLGDTHYSVIGTKATIFFLIMLALGIFYWLYLQGKKGWTPGKYIVGIRTVNEAGQAPGMLKAFLRELLWIVDSFPWIIPYLTGFIVALSTEKNQRVGDMVAKTYVVKKEAFGTPPFPPGGYGGGGGYAAPGAYPGGGGGFGQPQGGYSPPPPVPQAQQQAGGGQKADWYPDPQGQARLRYWDGNQWTDHTSN